MTENSNNTYVLSFKVDVGDAKGNLKEYKDHIDGLKGALLSLEKGTEEYEKVSTELRESQHKLNEVMDVAKGKGTALEGSYDNLVAKMADLKKQWRATADEIERDDLGKQILEINNQLKDLDASTGNFQRSVGNYAGAYEEAFKNVLGELGNMDGKLGDISKDMKGLIPLIKKVNQTALTGLSGIKKAIAATGIGLLVLAVAELVKHFDAVRKTVGITDEKFQEFKTNALEVIHKIVSGVVGVGNSILQFLLTPIRTVIEAFKGLGNVIKDVFTGNFKAIKEDAKNALDGIKDVLEKGINFKDSYNKGKEFADTLIANIQAEVNAKGGVTVPVKAKLELKEVDLSKLDSFIDPAIKARIEAEKKALAEQAEIDKITLEMLKETDAEIQAELDRANAEYLESVKKAREAEEKELNERKNFYKTFASATADIISTVADAWETSIKEQIEAGKMSEEEGKKQFESVKALQTSVAIINTISGIVAALTAPSLQNAGPFGWAAAIAQSVALAAAGAAQVAKIQSTTLGTTATQVTSVSTPNLGSIINDYQPTYVTNTTGQSEISQLTNAIQKTPIYVKVSDVESVTATQNQRVAETTF